MMVSLETSREGFDKAIQTVMEKRESINRDWEQNIIQIWTEEEQGKKIHRPNPQKTVSLS
jgi:hypothetical protein